MRIPLSTLPLLEYAPTSPFVALTRKALAWAARDCPIFLQGESGTGKEVMARFLHMHSSRKKGPFVAINCAALAPSLIESELFGHERGAFTGAVTRRPGRMRQAHEGTLFLDEIGDMPLDLQARLLRVLQEKKVCPVGGDEEIPVNFRLLCATHRNLSLAIRQGRFRTDLAYRIRVLELTLPSLRERRMDIPFLLKTFLAEYFQKDEIEQAIQSLPTEVLGYDFPGNIRELRNLAERYAALSATTDGNWKDVLGSGENMEYSSGALNLRNSRLSEKDILAALEACGHHRARAAEKLGVTRRALQYRLAAFRSAMVSH